jgi:hypothetical protein
MRRNTLFLFFLISYLLCEYINSQGSTSTSNDDSSTEESSTKDETNPSNSPTENSNSENSSNEESGSGSENSSNEEEGSDNASEVDTSGDDTGNEEDVPVEEESTSDFYNVAPVPSGSVNENIKKNDTLGKGATLEMVFMLHYPGKFRRKESLTGTFYKPIDLIDLNDDSSDDSSSSPTFNVVDLFNITWENTKIEALIPNITDKEANLLAANIKSMYRQQFSLLTNNTKEFSIIAQNSFFKEYGKQMIHTFYANDNVTEYTDVITENFDFKLYNQSYWNHESFYPVIPILNLEYVSKLFGFGIVESCSLFNNWKKLAIKNIDLNDYFYSKFNDTLQSWNIMYKPLVGFFVKGAKANEPEINFSTWLTNDGTDPVGIQNFYIFANALYSAYSVFGEKSVKKYLPKGGIKELQEMLKFLNYEYLLYSQMHSYLIISPFFEFMFQEFNVRLKNGETKNVTESELPNLKRKLTLLIAQDYVFYAIWKMYNFREALYPKYSKEASYGDGNGNLYDINDELIPKWSTNTTKLPYSNYTFVPFGYTLSFELWKKSNNEFDIVLRENFNQQPVFTLSKFDFNDAFQQILLEPGFSAKERERWCGKAKT